MYICLSRASNQVVEDSLVYQDDCAAVSVILLCSVVEAMVTAFEALDTALRYLTEAEWHPTPVASGSVSGHTLYYFCLFGM